MFNWLFRKKKKEIKSNPLTVPPTINPVSDLEYYDAQSWSNMPSYLKSPRVTIHADVTPVTDKHFAPKHIPALTPNVNHGMGLAMGLALAESAAVSHVHAAHHQHTPTPDHYSSYSSPDPTPSYDSGSSYDSSSVTFDVGPQ